MVLMSTDSVSGTRYSKQIFCAINKKKLLNSAVDQVGGLIPFSSEDCLYLNVHVPVTQDETPLPVMVRLY